MHPKCTLVILSTVSLSIVLGSCRVYHTTATPQPERVVVVKEQPEVIVVKQNTPPPVAVYQPAPGATASELETLRLERERLQRERLALEQATDPTYLSVTITRQ